MGCTILGLQGGILDAGGETGTALGYVRQLTVADDAGIRTRGKDEPDAEQGAMDEPSTGQKRDRYK